jgi:GDPmannose 4,6-dehydratase
MAKTVKRALIIGITGQDGSYLAELLLKKGYKVHGLLRRSSTFNRQNVDHLRGRVKYHYGDLTDPFSLIWALKKSKPHEVYNLGAMSHVQVSWEMPYYTAQATGVGVLNLLESIRVLGLTCKVYQASTSELFSGREKGAQSEKTEKDPVSPYGTAKLFGFQICKNYRDAYGMFVCNGILFNHESPRRGINFVTQKIVHEAHKGKVELGNINAKRDWGYAPHYCEGMWMMLQQKNPDDYVLATGKTTSVKDFVSFVEKAYGKEIKIITQTDYNRPTDVPVLRGNANKAKKVLGWKETVSVEELAKIMVKARYPELSTYEDNASQ